MCPVHSARTFAFLTLIFVAGTVGLQVVQARSLPRFEQAVAQSPDGDSFPVRIPLADGSRTGPVEYRIDATMRLGFPLHSVFHVIPDDCLTGLDVNGAAVPVQRASQASLCDWRNGLDIDLRGYVHPGYNKISMRVRNHNGPWGVQVRASRNDTAIAVLNAVFLLSLIPYLIASMAALGILRAHRWSFWAAAGLVVLGALLRFAFIYLVHAPEDHVFSDMASYVDAAVQIVAGQRGPQHLFHPIGYPLALAASLWLTDGFSLAVLLQYLMSVATFLLTWRGSVWFLGERRALLVLLVGALHFPFIALSGFFMAETGFSFLLSLLFYLLARRTFPWRPWYAFAIGAIYMAGAWLKGNNAMFGPVFIAWVALGVWRNRAYLVPARWRSIAKASAAFTAGACLVALVTAISTYALFGHARIAASVGALNFIEGKCPDKINADLGGSYWHSPLFVQLGEGGEKHWPAHFYDGAYFWKAGWGCIQRDPWVLVTSVRYVYYLFFDNQLWPVNASDYAALNRWYGMFFSALLFPGMLVGLVLVSRKPYSGRTAAFLPLASVCLVSWLLKSELRYRVPFDVVIIPLSVMGWTWLVGAVRLVPGSAVARFPRMARRSSDNAPSA
jgi:hypothetical protein